MNKITNQKTIAKRKAIAKMAELSGRTLLQTVERFNQLSKKEQAELINK